MQNENNSLKTQLNQHEVERQKRIGKQNKKLGFVILYLVVFVAIIVGEFILYKFEPQTTGWDLFKETLGNLMGVLAAFLIFDIAHEWLSKDSYASEISEQILDTLMYHPEAMELYENDQKKTFVNSFISSIVDDHDYAEMINNYLNCYLLTKEDFNKISGLTEKDCRIRTKFSYRFVLENSRTSSFAKLKADIQNDPYFYVQEELNYSVKFLSKKGNNTDKKEIKIGFIYDNSALDRFLRGNKSDQQNEILRNCIFRESLDIEDCDKKMFRELMASPAELLDLVKTMFRPNITIDRFHGRIIKAEVGDYEGKDYGIIVTFEVDHDVDAMFHDISIVFHIPKKWNGALEVVLVEPTKEPQISLSYNEDTMNVEMYSFLNKGESSAYENTSKDDNGIFSIALSDEWVFPISGVVFWINKEK